jgi:ABC-type maltose transport system permease subunit
MYIQNERWYTLAVGVYFKYAASTYSPMLSKPNVNMAVGAIMVILPAVLFMIFQRQLIEGITLTGVKG